MTYSELNSGLMQTLMAGIISLFLVATPVEPISPLLSPLSSQIVLSSVNYSLKDRYGNTYVNDIFADNILLTMAYMNGTVKDGQKVSWDKVRAPFKYTLELKPGDTFAFHDRVLREYSEQDIVTTNSRFNSTQGFKSDGHLVGDGVCHLASFINVAALKANLSVNAPTNHNFAAISDVPKEYGVAIYYDPNTVGSSQKQNLYITNNRENSIIFVFKYFDSKLDISVQEVVS